MERLESLYACELCGYKTSQKRYLDAHKKRKTPCAPAKPATVTATENATTPSPSASSTPPDVSGRSESSVAPAPASGDSSPSSGDPSSPNQTILVGHGSNSRVLSIMCLKPTTVDKMHDSIYAFDTAIRQPLSVPLDQARRLYDILQQFVAVYHEIYNAYTLQEQVQEAAARGDIVASQ